MKNDKIGKIDISELNVPPEKHEYETAKYFAKRGYDVEFILSNIILEKLLANPKILFLICVGSTPERKKNILKNLLKVVRLQRLKLYLSLRLTVAY